MRRSLRTLLLALMLALLCAAASAEPSVFETTAQVHPSLPALTLRVSATGITDETRRHPLNLRLDIRAQDGSLAQTLDYWSSEAPGLDRIVPMVRLEDLNFDGFGDLVLLTAQGASNVFVSFALYHEETGQFEPVMQDSPWNSETREIDREHPRQLELCNHTLHPEARMITTDENDGYRFTTEQKFVWEGRYGLSLAGVFCVYDAGKERIGEMLTLYGTGVQRVWDDQYPESWYYGERSVSQERRSCARSILLDRALVDPTWMEVDNVSWVNLRKQDSKSSPSLAQLPRGTAVIRIAGGIGTDAGWVRVLYMPESYSADYATWPDGSPVWLTGYIWHSYLAPHRP